MSVRVISGILKLNLKVGMADNYKRDISMIEPIEHTGITSGPSSYQAAQIIPAECSGFNDERAMSQTSSKYILYDNKIVFERYDRNGKLISRVPWTAHRVSAEA